MAKDKQTFPGWQTMDRAAQRAKVTRQRVHQVVHNKGNGIDTLRVFHYVLVPDPFPYKFRGSK